MPKKILVAVCVMAVGLVVACGRSTNPMSPSPAATGGELGADGSNLKIDPPTLVSPTGNVQLTRGVPLVLRLNNVSGRYTSFPVTYEVEVRTAAGALVANPKFGAAGGSQTTFTVTTELAFDTAHTWRARATYQRDGRNGVGPWSQTAPFRTPKKAFNDGLQVFDPLDDGTTVGSRVGGHFVPGQGWMADGYFDGIDYDLQACPSCRLEFDVTNVGNGLGYPADLKFLSMGDGTAFGDFTAFRNHDWKMHLEQRGDGDGTGMKLIWRIDGDDDDHDTKILFGGPNWKDNQVFHFVLDWTPDSYEISINGEVWFDGDLQDAFVPPNFRISLGCYPRGETLKGAIWRNVQLTRR